MPKMSRLISRIKNIWHANSQDVPAVRSRVLAIVNCYIYLGGQMSIQMSEPYNRCLNCDEELSNAVLALVLAKTQHQEYQELCSDDCYLENIQHDTDTN